jgi:hypothetical protein
MNLSESNHHFAIFAIFLLPLFLSTFCTNYKTEKPSISLEVSNNLVTVNSNVTFKVTGNAEFLTIWTGDYKHNYNEYCATIAHGDTAKGSIVKPIDAGEVIEGHTFTYQYKTAGIFKVVILATNVGEFGETLEVQKIEHQITVQ